MDFPDDKKSVSSGTLPSVNQELHSADSASHHRSQGRRRVFRVLTLFITSLVLLSFLSEDIPAFAYRQYALMVQDEWPIPPTLTVHECPELEQEKDTSVHFDVPLSDKLLFFSRGSWSVGVLYLSQSTEDSDSVGVDVKVVHDGEHHHDLDIAKVCSVTSEDGANGVAIFTPHHNRHRREHYRLHFDVYVTLPKAATNLKSLEVDMPVFSQRIGDLSSIEFERFLVKTAAASISVDGVVADFTDIENSSGSISGHFNTSSYLELHTANGAIDVSVDATNIDDAVPTVVKLRTANGLVKASLALHSTNTTGGSFQTTAETAHGAVTLDFPLAPSNSSLYVEAKSAIGSVDVGLHETYEGAFELHTSLGRTEVIYDQETERKRGRFIDIETLKGGKLEGTIYRSEAGKERGGVTLETTLASAVIRL